MEAYTKIRELTHKRGHLLAQWCNKELDTPEELDLMDEIDNLDADVREWLPRLLKDYETLHNETIALKARE